MLNVLNFEASIKARCSIIIYQKIKKLDAFDPDLEISYQDLLKDDHQYFWQVVGHYDQLQQGGLYIHSNAEPLGGF